MRSETYAHNINSIAKNLLAARRGVSSVKRLDTAVERARREHARFLLVCETRRAKLFGVIGAHQSKAKNLHALLETALEKDVLTKERADVGETRSSPPVSVCGTKHPKTSDPETVQPHPHRPHGNKKHTPGRGGSIERRHKKAKPTVAQPSPPSLGDPSPRHAPTTPDLLGDILKDSMGSFSATREEASACPPHSLHDIYKASRNGTEESTLSIDPSRPPSPRYTYENLTLGYLTWLEQFVGRVLSF